MMKTTEGLTFNYSNIFYGYYFEKERHSLKMVHDHMLAYIYSGELVVQSGAKKMVVGKGECVFIKKDHRINLTKQPNSKEQEPFRGVFMNFTRSFLREFFQTLDLEKIADITCSTPNARFLRMDSLELTSLFHSLTPYFKSSTEPSAEILKLKQLEGLHAVLNIDREFYKCLFDFTEPWKIDILDFMNTNYMYDMSLGDIANFTGRSLATFKRDFKKASELTPQRWLMQKRLEVAHEKITMNKENISDVYLEVGFKNLSHFSTAFKRKYGIAPSQVID